MKSRGISEIVSLGFVTILLVGCGSRPEESLRTNASALGPPLAADASTVSDATVSNIEAFIAANYYADSDIQHSFHTIFGEQVDCIDFYAQPSIRMNIAAGLSVTAPPSTLDLPPGGSDVPPGPDAFSGAPDEDGNARACSGDTVPISRPTVEQVQAAGGILAFQNRPRPHPRDSNQNTHQYDCYEIPNQTILNGILSTANNYDHVVGYQHVDVAYLIATLSVNNPYLFSSSDHSAAQVWLQTGGCEYWVDPYSCDPPTESGGSNEAVQSVETGWLVGAPYSGTSPHLFTFTTVDGYHEQNWYGDDTGTPWVIAPGAKYKVGMTLSSSNSPPYPELSIDVYNYSPGDPNWYVIINGSLIGWFPVGPSGMSPGYAGIMRTHADYLQAGGEVFSGSTTANYTATKMGTGTEPASGTYRSAAYVRDVGYFENVESAPFTNASLSYISGLPSFEQDDGNQGVCGFYAGNGFSKCSSSCPPGNSSWDSFFYYGGAL
jgi:hypothetical protein